jgi:uncharacterized membrane protein
MDVDPLRKQLETEYLHLQKVVEDFDGRALLIKGWSVTFSLAQIAVAFTSESPSLFLVAALTATLFWALETSWKGFQYAYHGRIRDIEAYFSAESPPPIPAFQISTRWFETFHAEVAGRYFEFARWPHVCLPHAVVVVLGLGMYVVY